MFKDDYLRNSNYHNEFDAIEEASFDYPSERLIYQLTKMKCVMENTNSYENYCYVLDVFNKIITGVRNHKSRYRRDATELEIILHLISFLFREMNYLIMHFDVP